MDQVCESQFNVITNEAKYIYILNFFISDYISAHGRYLQSKSLNNQKHQKLNPLGNIITIYINILLHWLDIHLNGPHELDCI